MDEIDYGKRVRELRGDMTQPEFAALVGISKRALQAIELGETKKPNTDTRRKLDAAKAKIEAKLGFSTPQATRARWPEDVQGYLDGLGAFIVAQMPTEDEREAWYGTETLRLFKQFGQRKMGTPISDNGGATEQSGA